MAKQKHERKQQSGEQAHRRITRREMLKLSGAFTAGSLLVAQRPGLILEPTEALTDAPGNAPSASVTNVVVMHQRNELSEDQENQFETSNPDITIEFLGLDLPLFFSMYAAGNPPDLLRVSGASIPNYLYRGVLYDLTSYFEASTVLEPDDLAPVNNYYRANSPFEIGAGAFYGICKDWSPDFTVFIYTQPFIDAGIDVPDAGTPLTYQQVRQHAWDLLHAGGVAHSTGKQALTFGYGYFDSWIDRIWMNMLAELGEHLYSEGFTRIVLTGNEAARAVVQYYYDLAADNLVSNPLNPSPSWVGGDFTNGILAMIQTGYWFSAMAESATTAGKVKMLPAPTWAGVPRDPCMTGTGMIMAAISGVPNEAWRIIEWYNGLEPAIERASSGWGVPPLKSLYHLMPNTTAFQQQVQSVLMGELALNTPVLQFNPFLEENVVANAWWKYLEQALKHQITFDEMLASIEEEVNDAILSQLSNHVYLPLVLNQH